MGIVKEKYSNSRLSMLQEVLTNDFLNDQARDFEIWVDDLKIIQRTSDAERFDSYEGFINAETKSITIVIYEKKSNRNTRFIFLLQDEKKEENKKPEATLEGIENTIKEKLTQEKKEWQHELLVQEKAKIEKELEDAENYIETLEKALVDAKENRWKIGDIPLGEIASVALEGFVRRNPQIIAKIPGAEGLAGLIAEDNKEKGKQLATTNEPDTEASFKRKDDAEELSAEDKDYLDFLKQLKGKFDETQLIKVMSVLDMFADETSSIDPAIEFIKSRKKENREEKKATA